MTVLQRLRRFWRRYCRRYRLIYLLGLICLLATNGLTVAIPGFVQRAVDALGAGRPAGDAVVWAWAILAAGVGVIVVRTLSRVLFFNPGRTIEFRLKNDLFDRLLELPRSFYDAKQAGEIISRGTNDVGSVRALVGFAGLQLFNTVLTFSLALGKMLWIDVELTLLCAAPLIAAAIVLGFAVRAMYGLTRELQAQLATLSDRVLELYNGVGVLQTYGAVPGAVRLFDEANDRLLCLGGRLIRIRSWLLPVVSVVGSTCVVLLLYFGGRRVVQGTFTLGELAAFSVYINILVVGLTSAGWLINSAQRGYVGLSRVDEVLDTPTGRPPAHRERPVPGPGGHALQVRGLRFAYPGSEPALAEVDFEVAAGETLGIFGLTGAGKSTLLQVLARVYEPPPGAVLLDGVDVRDIPVRDYWRGVAYVPQEAFLFSRSLRENVALARTEEIPDEARLQAAVADAALADDLEILPGGLDTRIGERGVTLSGGQRQRAALARAFYRDFDLLLLDDVLSAVDHATEQRLIDAIYRRGAGTTALIVSHRVSALARADRVIVLDRGRVVDQGTHATLIAQGRGPYHRAWWLQQAAEALERGERADG